MKILMEDWLIGCAHHDGRHGEVILPTIKVLEIADYIRRTRTSQTDGCLEIPPTDEFVEKELKKVLKRNLEQTFPISEQTEPQTDDFFREPTAEERKAVADYIDSISVPTGVNVFDLMDEPQTVISYTSGSNSYGEQIQTDQTDCSWK